MPEVPLIIRGGQAVPPQEVEQVLLGHPAVAELAVVGVPDPGLQEIVAAAVRLSAPLPSAAADLTEYCRARLPRYKVPARWLFIPALPRTAAGEPCRATLTAQLAVTPGPGGPTWTAGLPADLFLPRPAIEDLRIPRQLRRPWAPDDLDSL